MSATNPSPAPSEEEVSNLGFSFHIPEVENIDVFVVDDDKTSLTLMVALLEQTGHPVQAFSGALEALAALRAKLPKILVTDLVMPNLTGLELAEEARALDPDIGVILVTAYGDESTAAASLRLGLQLGVSHFLAKPVDSNTLSRAVQRAFLRRAADEHHRAMVDWMYDALARNAHEIREVTVGTLTSLINAVDARSPHFRGHSQAVAMQAAATAQALGQDEEEVEAIRIAAASVPEA